MTREAAHAVDIVVLDTNVVLDLFVFRDAEVASLAHRLADGSLQWLATQAMRDELVRVLGYRNVVGWLARHGQDPVQAAADVLARFDRAARLVNAAPAAPLACRDPDDQGFIDLALAHAAELFSKDRAVIEVWKRVKATPIKA